MGSRDVVSAVDAQARVGPRTDPAADSEPTADTRTESRLVPGPGPDLSLSLVPWDDDAAARLRAEQQAELRDRYGEDDIGHDMTGEAVTAMVLVRLGGEPVACGALQDASAQLGVGVGELKRMFVRPHARGRGLSRLVLAELEHLARESGLGRLVLETGVRQPEAVGLYRSAGYRRIPDYGEYIEEPTSVCYGRWLDPDRATRVLVVNGTMGAGKTTVADAIGTLLRERQLPHVVVDVDELCHVWPPADDDPHADAVAFEALTALGPSLGRRGYRHVVLARVVEDAADRELYEQAFAGADVVIVRITADEGTRTARLTARERDPGRRRAALARTVELHTILEAAGVDDAVVADDERPAPDVAADVLRAAGW